MSKWRLPSGLILWRLLWPAEFQDGSSCRLSVYLQESCLESRTHSCLFLLRELLVDAIELEKSSLCSTTRIWGDRCTHSYDKGQLSHAITPTEWGIYSRTVPGSIRTWTPYGAAESAAGWIWVVSTPLWILWIIQHQSASFWYEFGRMDLDRGTCRRTGSEWSGTASESRSRTLSIDPVLMFGLITESVAPYVLSGNECQLFWLELFQSFIKCTPLRSNRGPILI